MTPNGTSQVAQPATPAARGRIDWVDYAKGICIILVVMMHSTLGVEKAAGGISWLNGFIEWARPFRMPDFFLISGLFLASRINRPWREFLDSKVLHFVYFYVLWMTIQFATKGYGIYQADGPGGMLQAYAMGLVEPFGTLWFIYMLAIFFVVVKALRNVAPALVFAAAALLEMAPIETGSLLIDEFAHDRNVEIITENESPKVAAPGINATINSAQIFLPWLARPLSIRRPRCAPTTSRHQASVTATVAPASEPSPRLEASRSVA